MRTYTFSLENHLVIFRPADNRLFLLNPTASWIWQATEAGMLQEDITNLLAEQYQITASTIMHDVQSTLTEWTEQGLDPTRSAQDSEKTAPPSVPCKSRPPADKTISFQHHFFYGQTSFTLTDYTSDFASSLAPLCNNLPQCNSEAAAVHIEIFKDNDEYVIAAGQRELERTNLENIAVGRVIQAMVESAYPHSHWMAFIHAASGSYNGQGVIFPASGGSGKSTLMAALSQTGWTYWGDDTVPLDINGKAAAIPLNQCIKSGSWQILSPYYPQLETLPVFNRYNNQVRYLPVLPDASEFTDPLDVHTLIFPGYAANCDQTLEPINPVQALQCLIDSQTWISPNPNHAEAMINWISTIPAYSLRYHDLAWASEELKQVISSGNK